MERTRAAALNHRTFGAVPVRHLEAPAPCLLQPPCSRESCPPPIPSLWPQNRAGCVYRAGTAPSGLRANTSPRPRHSQAPQPGLDLAEAWALRLAPVEEEGQPVPPDLSRDPGQSPEHTATHKGTETENECFLAQGASTHWAQKSWLGLGRVSL